jgi:hypothetical protein
MTLKIQGTNQSVVIDLEKFKDCMTILDETVEEKDACHEDYVTKIDEISSENVSEEEYLNKVVAAIGEVKENENGRLSKDMFIRIFKYTGDFGKMRA